MSLEEDQLDVCSAGGWGGIEGKGREGREGMGWEGWVKGREGNRKCCIAFINFNVLYCSGERFKKRPIG